MKLSTLHDKNQLVDFLKKDYANNLCFFHYLDDRITPDPGASILTAGENGAISLALLISKNHCCISALDPGHIDAIAGQIPDIYSHNLLGRRDYTQKLLDIIGEQGREIYTCNFCRLNKLPEMKGLQSQQATAVDLPNMIDFYKQDEWFPNIETRLPDYFKTGTIFYTAVDDKIVSCALTTTETEDIAMVGAVFTSADYRGKGFARDCVAGLCRNLVQKNKRVYLFHDTGDPIATRLYANLGFVKIGEWLFAIRKEIFLS